MALRNKSGVAVSLVVFAVAWLAAPEAAIAQPDPISDLKATPQGPGEVKLEWTSPAGLPSSKWLKDSYYEIRHSGVHPSTLPGTWWDSAEVWPAHPVPLPPGSLESLLITGMDPMAWTWFVIRSWDDKQGYWSEDSNPAGLPPVIPELPASPGLYKRDGVTSLVTGGTTTQSALVVRAVVDDLGGRDSSLQAEIKAGFLPFDETEILTGSVVAPGTEASVPVDGLAPATGYRLRIRTVNSAGYVSGWVDVGLADDGEIDITTTAGSAPSADPVDQLLVTGEAIEIGSTITGDQVTFSATLAQADGNAVLLEIEVRPAGVPFSNVATQSGSQVASGTLSSATQSLPTGAYHWQVRGVEAEFGIVGPWTSFGGNDETAADFILQASGSSGNSVPCQGSAAAGRMWMGVALLGLAFLRRAA